MRIAIFGLGSIGKRHVHNLVEMGETDLIAYDPLVLKIVQMEGMPLIPLAGSEQDVWSWKPEAVLICTPPLTHYALAMRAFNQGCHVFIEKPIATNVQNANDLVWRNDDKKVLAVGYQLRFHRMTNLKRKKNHQSWFFSLQDMSKWPSQYRKDTLHEFSHELDLAVWTNGPVEAVTATQSGGMWNIQMRHLGATSWVMLNGESLNPFRYANQASGKVWEFDGMENDQAYKHEINAFLNACRGDGWDDRLCSGPEAVHVVKIIEAARQSAQDCKVVRLA